MIGGLSPHLSISIVQPELREWYQQALLHYAASCLVLVSLGGAWEGSGAVHCNYGLVKVLNKGTSVLNNVLLFKVKNCTLDNFYPVVVKKAHLREPSKWICPCTPANKWGMVLKRLICWLITETNTSTSSGTQNKQLPDSTTQSNWPDGMLQPTPAQRLDEIKILLGEQVFVQYTQR